MPSDVNAYTGQPQEYLAHLGSTAVMAAVRQNPEVHVIAIVADEEAAATVTSDANAPERTLEELLEGTVAFGQACGVTITFAINGEEVRFAEDE